MYPKRVSFYITKRVHAYCPRGEWAIFAAIDGSPRWNFHCWKHAPTAEEIESIKDVFMRSCQIYHTQISHPKFGLTIVPGPGDYTLEQAE